MLCHKIVASATGTKWISLVSRSFHDEVLTVQYATDAQHDDAYQLLSTMEHVVNTIMAKTPQLSTSPFQPCSHDANAKSRDDTNQTPLFTSRTT
jgi:hypothetical protein